MAKSSRKSRGRLRAAVGRFPFRAALWLMVTAVLIAAIVVGGRTVWAAVVRHPEFRLDARAMVLGGYPAWVEGDAMSRELLKELTALPGNTSIFAPDLAHRVQHELRSAPWVLDVTRVERVLPNRLAVYSVFRQPLGVVLYDGVEWVVDADGYWLPDSLFDRTALSDSTHLPLIVDRGLDSPPPVGAPWDNPELAVGARLTRDLLQSGILREVGISTIDVTRVGTGSREPEIVIMAKSGAEIRWGKSSVYAELIPHAQSPLQVTDEEKMRMLRSVLSEDPGLEALAGRYIDLRYHRKIIVPQGG